ncbi:probable serine/threonine-protein kinase PBL3 [Dioscorea cayenensis subsp. rotundata]|uniref:non-specific serine/threonine protein kinase n=1 Tax=Dioscorea cayennensis subsp. rotundata TaxID=55577 RepID=A0AB40BEZ5_DIOCR|nr:probable serine/threonine-protein kinase PBL3 [Dioscorea cayenensis subsp. rotundata]
MGNCVQLVRRAETPHHSSDPSKASSKKAVSSAHSSQTTYSNPSTLTVPSYTSTLTVPSYIESSSYTERSNTENPPSRTEEEILASSSLKDFPFNELRIATRNFRPESLIGEGGFGNVYKGWIDEQTFTAAKPGSGMIVAVKKLKPESFQGHKEWLAEVNYLGQLRHPNLVKLIGYCSDGENRLLVYEYLLKGSLENHLFRRSTQPLNWALRIKVAVGAARGLTFLHESEFQIIYRDVKSSNILLDSEYNVKLSDFGLAKEGPTGGKTHISTQIMGTQGYAAPEYIATGRLSVKADVYSYGVVLLELLSGRRAVDNSRGGIEQNLVEWARPLLADKRKQNLIMDSRLEGRYPKKDAHAVATLASQCISTQAKSRPKMSEVLATLEALQT